MPIAPRMGRGMGARPWGGLFTPDPDTIAYIQQIMQQQPNAEQAREALEETVGGLLPVASVGGLLGSSLGRMLPRTPKAAPKIPPEMIPTDYAAAMDAANRELQAMIAGYDRRLRQPMFSRVGELKRRSTDF